MSLREWIEEIAPEALLVGEPGDTSYDGAILGIAERCSQPPLIVYDRQKLVEIFARQFAADGSDDPLMDAEEWVSFNIDGAWMGPGTPLMLHRSEDECVT